MATSVFSRIAKHIQPIDYLLHSLCSPIPSLGLTSRKAILDVCQTARHAEEYEVLDTAVQSILDDREIRPHAVKIYAPQLVEALYQVSQSQAYRALVSMLVRNEPIDQFSDAEGVILEGFAKEFSASQRERPEQFGISYQCLDQDNYHPAPYSIYYHPTPQFAGFAKRSLSVLVLRRHYI